MRSRKKSKERDTESKNQPVVASVSKLICASKGQSSTLNGKLPLEVALFWLKFESFFEGCCPILCGNVTTSMFQ